MPSPSPGGTASLRLLRPCLAALLALGVPGPGLDAFASEPAAPAPGAAALSVTSDPAGAAVYVNGRLAGQTPLTVHGVAPGEHRVRLVKDGYLENSRVVSVKPGSGEAMEVRLTRAAGEARRALQQEPDIDEEWEEEGGGSKALWIGLGVAAAGAGGYFLVRDANEAPSAGTITITPGAGLASATRFDFSVSGAGDPDGDALMFAWSFGDFGAGGGGQTTTHVYEESASYDVTVTVSDGKRSAIAHASVDVKSLTGRWSGVIASGSGVPTVIDFTQEYDGFVGDLDIPVPGLPNDAASGTVFGSVSHPLAVTFSVKMPCCAPFVFQGTADSDVTRLTGTVTGSGFNGQGWTLTRQ